MKAHIRTNQNIEYETEELEFYNICYNALKKLEKTYLPEFNLDRLISDITSVTTEDKRKIYVELLSLRNLFFSVLLGLKKEELESANSLVKQHRLFQYKDYDGDVDVYIDENNSIKWKDFANEISSSSVGLPKFLHNGLCDSCSMGQYGYVECLTEGYWTATSLETGDICAWYVGNYGYLDYDYDINSVRGPGIRPVITIENN